MQGTRDDRAFETIEQVDAVPWVGPAAIARLVAFAEGNGWVPSGGDVLGVYDDVAFTVDEAEATLALVNQAAHAVLDDDIDLDKRAADGIVAARPIATMTALAAVYYVGPSAMLALREYPQAARGPSRWFRVHDPRRLCVGTLRGVLVGLGRMVRRRIDGRRLHG